MPRRAGTRSRPSRATTRMPPRHATIRSVDTGEVSNTDSGALVARDAAHQRVREHLAQDRAPTRRRQGRLGTRPRVPRPAAGRAAGPPHDRPQAGPDPREGRDAACRGAGRRPDVAPGRRRHGGRGERRQRRSPSRSPSCAELGFPPGSPTGLQRARAGVQPAARRPSGRRARRRPVRRQEARRPAAGCWPRATRSPASRSTRPSTRPPAVGGRGPGEHLRRRGRPRRPHAARSERSPGSRSRRRSRPARRSSSSRPPPRWRAAT